MAAEESNDGFGCDECWRTIGSLEALTDKSTCIMELRNILWKWVLVQSIDSIRRDESIKQKGDLWYTEQQVNTISLYFNNPGKADQSPSQ